MSIIDVIFLILVGLFGMIAFMRGITGDFLSTANWVLASITAIFLSPIIASHISGISSKIALNIVTNIVIFLATLVLISMVNSRYTSKILAFVPNEIDKPLGLAFGVFKGYFVAVILFSIHNHIYSYISNDKNPSWVQNAKSLKMLEAGEVIASPIISKFVAENISNRLPSMQSSNNTATTNIDDDSGDTLSSPSIKSPQDMLKKSGQGYNKGQIEEMQKLINVISK